MRYYDKKIVSNAFSLGTKDVTRSDRLNTVIPANIVIKRYSAKNAWTMPDKNKGGVTLGQMARSVSSAGPNRSWERAIAGCKAQKARVA
jgi:hypothetical protein